MSGNHPKRESPRKPIKIGGTSDNDASTPGGGKISPNQPAVTMTTRSKTDPAGMVAKRKVFIAGGLISRTQERSPVKTRHVRTSSASTPGEINSGTRASVMEKAKDGSLIYNRRRISSGASETTGMKKRMGVERKSPVEIERSLSQAAPGRKVRTRWTNSVGEEKSSDGFCWICDKEIETPEPLTCELCPRAFHQKCAGLDVHPEEWVCPECEKAMRSDCVETRTQSMAMLSPEQLFTVLRYSLQRMKFPESEPFSKPVDHEDAPNYSDYIINPVDLMAMERNVRKRTYGSTDAFLSDVKWIYHNCVIYNGWQHKLTRSAKTIIKICKHEMAEIEICPDCYLNSCTKRNQNWFCEPCRIPHTLVWAKMKGYPFWPAKALREVNGQVDVRFFGEHDRSWVALNQVFLLSDDPPVAVRKGTRGFDESMEEVRIHIKRIRDKFGEFEHAPARTPYIPPVQGGTARQSPKGKSPSKSSPGTSGRKSATLSKSSTDTNSIKSTASSIKLTTSSIIPANKIKKEVEDVKQEDWKPSDTQAEQKKEAGISSRASTPASTGGVFEMCKSELGDVKELKLSITPVKVPENAGKLSNPSLIDSIEQKVKRITEIVDIEESESTEDTPRDTPITERSDTPRSLDKNPTPSSEIASSSTSQPSGNLPDTSSAERSETPHSETQNDELPESSTQDDLVSEGKDTPKDEHLGKEKGEPMDTDESQDTNTEDKTEVTTETSSQKVNSFLENVVASCKAKLGLDGKEVPDIEDVEEEEEEEEESGNTSAGSGSSSGESSSGETADEESEDETESKNEGEEEKAESKESLLKNTSEEELKSEAKEESSNAKESEKMVTDHLDTPSTVVEMKNGTKDSPATTADTVGVKRKSSAATEGVSEKKQKTTDSSETASLSEKMEEDKSGTVCKDNDDTVDESVPEKKTEPSGIKASEKPGDTLTQQSDKDAPSQPSTKDTPPMETQSAPSVDKMQTTSSAKETEPSSAADEAQPPSSADFKWNLQGFDFSRYTNAVMSSVNQTMQSLCEDFVKADQGSSVQKHMQTEIDRMRWRHQQEMEESKHNSELTLAEMRIALDSERNAALQELRKKLHQEKVKAVEEAKKKQWCANCHKEAIFYCCWNTSYCDYPCQQNHWPKHMTTCTQASGVEGEGELERTASSAGQLQSWKKAARESLNAALEKQEERTERRQAATSYSQGATTVSTPQLQPQFIQPRGQRQIAPHQTQQYTYQTGASVNARALQSGAPMVFQVRPPPRGGAPSVNMGPNYQPRRY